MRGFGQLVGHTPKGNAKSRCRFDSDFVVHGRSDPLRAAEITFGGLHRDVAKKKLNLLQFATRGAAEASSTSPEIMRREFADANLTRKLLDDVPERAAVPRAPASQPLLASRRNVRLGGGQLYLPIPGSGFRSEGHT